MVSNQWKECARALEILALVLLLTQVSLTRVTAADPDAAAIAAGERLVHNMDCNVCHTPKTFGPQGPQLNTAYLLAGHRADETIPPIPKELLGPTGWGGLFNNSSTAWVGRPRSR